MNSPFFCRWVTIASVSGEELLLYSHFPPVETLCTAAVRPSTTSQAKEAHSWCLIRSNKRRGKLVALLCLLRTMDWTVSLSGLSLSPRTNSFLAREGGEGQLVL